MDIQIVMQESPRTNFTMLPNIVDDMNLDPFSFRLYVHLRRIAGENGACWQSTTNLASACRMSVGQICNSKKALVEAGLINIEKRQGAHGFYDYITIIDIWRKNTQMSSEDGLGGERSYGERKRSYGERKRSYGETNKITLTRSHEEDNYGCANAQPGADAPTADAVLQPERQTVSHPPTEHTPEPEPIKRAPKQQSVSPSSTPVRLQMVDESDEQVECLHCHNPVIIANLRRYAAICPSCGSGLFVYDPDGRIAFYPPREMRSEQKVIHSLSELPNCPKQISDFPVSASDLKAIRELQFIGEFYEQVNYFRKLYLERKCAWRNVAHNALVSTQRRLAARGLTKTGEQEIADVDLEYFKQKGIDVSDLEEV